MGNEHHLAIVTAVTSTVAPAVTGTQVQQLSWETQLKSKPSYDAHYEISIITEAKSLNNCQVAKMSMLQNAIGGKSTKTGF